MGVNYIATQITIITVLYKIHEDRNIFHWEFGTEKPRVVYKVSLELFKTQELISAFMAGGGVMISWRRKHEEFYWIEDG